MGSMTILVVDDDQEMLDLHRTVLERHGFNICTAATLEEAERLYLDNRDKLAGIILDGCMPDYGHTTKPLIKLMRENKRAGLCKAVIVAASGDRLLRKEMTIAGCDLDAGGKRAAAMLLIQQLESLA